MLLTNKPNGLLVLRSLFDGNLVNLQGRFFRLNDENKIVMRVNTANHYSWISCDLRINDFIKMCDELTDKDLIEICFSRIMNECL